MGLQLKIIDKGYKKFVSEIKNFDKNPKVKIGILEGNADRVDGKDNVDLMTKHEYGVGVPQRSVIRAGTDSNIDNIFNNTIVDQYDKIIIGHSNVIEMVNKTGAVVKTKFRERFSTKYLEPNAPFTIAKKGSDVPLVETGELKDTINYKVE